MTIPVITIDGPSGVGKGTISALAAEAFGFHSLDSGALFRIAAYATTSKGLDCSDEKAVLAVLDAAVIEFHPPQVILNGEDISELIRTEAVAKGASIIAQYGAVRERLKTKMLEFKKAPGLVADGRDMGTVVFPEATLKIFLTASNEIRAKRRFKQLSEKGKSVTLSDVLNELNARDERDSTRAVAPLKPASDAVQIDTSDLDVTAVFAIVQKAAAQVGIVP